MRRTRLGRRLRTGSSSALIVLPFIGVSAFMSASLGHDRGSVDSSDRGSFRLELVHPVMDYRTLLMGVQPTKNLYDQNPEEPVVSVATPASSAAMATPSFNSRFEFEENDQSPDSTAGGTPVLGHIAPPKSSNFFAEFGMDNGFSKKGGMVSSKVQVIEDQESDEARKKFSNAKSISSSQFLGDQGKAGDMEAQTSLQKFTGQQDISSLKNIAGETRKKLTSLASAFLNDLQDRVL